MNPTGQLPMLELPGMSSSYYGEPSMDVPQAMEGLRGISPPPFLTKTCDLVDDPNTNHIVSWSKGNNSFVVWDPEAFRIQLLPKYFKHSNLSSFIRQLNTYGFRKVDPDKLEFASEWFLRGQKHLLKNIKRRKPPCHPQDSHQGLDSSCVEVGQFGPETEIDRLRRDKQVLMVELVKLRQEQQNTRAHLKKIENRLKGAEMKRQHIMGFLARLIQNPSFLQQLNVHQDRRKKLEEVISKKGRRAIDQGLSNVEVIELGQGKAEIDSKLEPENYGAIKVSKLKTPSVDMQAPCGTSKESEERKDGGHKSLDKGFWEELLNDGIGEQMGSFGDVAEEEEENVDMLYEQLGFFGF